MATSRQARWGSSLILGLLFATGCGEDSAGPGGDSTVRDGTFVDSAVAGMSFSAGDQSGLTDAEGTFHYPSSAASITFAIGDIVVGSGKPAKVMSPLALSPDAVDLTDARTINVARLLQTLDDDADAGNGILITEAVRNAAAGASVDFDRDAIAFESDGDLQTLLATLTAATSAGVRAMVSSQDAQQHLASTLLAALQGQHSGKYCRDTGDTGAQVNAGTWSMTVGTDGQATISFNGTPSFSVAGTFDIYGTLNADGTSNSYVYAAYDGSQFWGRWYTDTESGSFSQSSNCSH